MHRLFDMADALGVHIRYADLSHLDRDGDYDHARREIRLQDGMAYRLHRSVLAHELAHAVFGDVRSMFGPVNAKQERRADEWAAMQLISIDDFRHAEHVRGGHTWSMAHDLDVIEDLVIAYRRALERIGDTVYVKPRMGAQQWIDRITLPETA